MVEPNSITSDLILLELEVHQPAKYIWWRAHQPIGQVWGWTLLGDTLGRARQGGRLSLLFSCKAAFLFIAGDPIVSAVNHTLKAVVRIKEAPFNVQI